MKNKKKLSKEEKIRYILVNPTLNYEKLADDLGYKNSESMRDFFKRNKLPNKRNNSQAQRTGDSLAGMVAKAIKNKKKTLRDLADQFNTAPKNILSAIEELKADNILVDNFSDSGFALSKDIERIDAPLIFDSKKYKETEYAIGFVTDNHIGSKYERMDVLNALYDRFAEYKIDTVYNGGNWIDGEHRFNKHDIYVHGVHGQIKNFIEKYPQRKGIKTYLISGDDHEGWYVQRDHVNIGQLMELVAKKEGRDDLIDIGYMERDIELKQRLGSSKLRIIHAGGGSSYAHSYTAQKYVEALQGGEKPHIILVGHYHKFNYSYPREVHVIQGGTTEDQTPFMRKKKLQAMVGGCVLWITQNELGIITKFKVEWIPFYDRKFYKYIW